MAKIKQEKMRLGLNPNESWHETVVNICYDSTDRSTEHFRRPVPTERFYIKLPQVVADALGMPVVRGSDQAEVMVRFKETIEQFKNLSIETNRVILYAFDVEPKPGSKDAESRFFHGNYKVSVWAGTYEETIATAGDGAKRYSYEKVQSSVTFDSADWTHSGPDQRRESKRFDCQVPWTKQNEEFFLWIKGRMKNLIDRLHELKSSDKLVDAISSGLLLPL